MMKFKINTLWVTLFIACPLFAEPQAEPNVQNPESKAEQPIEELTDQQRIDLAQQAIEKDEWEKAFNLVYPVALKGNHNIQANLGLFYLQGKGVEQDYDKAYWWFSESAEKGNIKGINNLALMFLEGKGVKKNIPHAIKLLEKTANVGDLRATMLLAKVYLYDMNDPKKSLPWFEAAAKKGQNEARFQLAQFYDEGKGTKKDKTKAIYWYQETLKANDQFSRQAKIRLEKLLCNKQNNC